MVFQTQPESSSSRHKTFMRSDHWLSCPPADTFEESIQRLERSHTCSSERATEFLVEAIIALAIMLFCFAAAGVLLVVWRLKNKKLKPRLLAEGTAAGPVGSVQAPTPAVGIPQPASPPAYPQQRQQQPAYPQQQQQPAYPQQQQQPAYPQQQQPAYPQQQQQPAYPQQQQQPAYPQQQQQGNHPQPLQPAGHVGPHGGQGPAR